MVSKASLDTMTWCHMLPLILWHGATGDTWHYGIVPQVTLTTMTWYQWWHLILWRVTPGSTWCHLQQMTLAILTMHHRWYLVACIKGKTDIMTVCDRCHVTPVYFVTKIIIEYYESRLSIPIYGSVLQVTNTWDVACVTTWEASLSSRKKSTASGTVMWYYNWY